MRAFQPSYAPDCKDASFGERFRRCVQHCGKTRKEVALAIGLSPAQVGRICRGGVSMLSDPATVERAARLFGVSSVWLYAGQNAPARMRPEWL